MQSRRQLFQAAAVVVVAANPSASAAAQPCKEEELSAARQQGLARLREAAMIDDSVGIDPYGCSHGG